MRHRAKIAILLWVRLWRGSIATFVVFVPSAYAATLNQGPPNPGFSHASDLLSRSQPNSPPLNNVGAVDIHSDLRLTTNRRLHEVEQFPRAAPWPSGAIRHWERWSTRLHSPGSFSFTLTVSASPPLLRQTDF